MWKLSNPKLKWSQWWSGPTYSSFILQIIAILPISEIPFLGKQCLLNFGHPPIYIISNNNDIIYSVSQAETTKLSSTIFPPLLYTCNGCTIFVLRNAYEINLLNLLLPRSGYHFLNYFKSLLHLSYMFFYNLTPTNTTSAHYIWPYSPVTQNLPPFVGHSTFFHNFLHFISLWYPIIPLWSPKFNSINI